MDMGNFQKGDSMFELVKEIKKDIRKQLRANKVLEKSFGIFVGHYLLLHFNVIINYIRNIFYKMINKPNEWEQSIIDNAVEYSVMM